ncbi:hypothetical protein Tco_0734893 [Tanacetum coccineum]
MIVSGQSGTLAGQGSACNHGCGHRLPSAYVLRKYLICVRLETSGPQPAYPGLSGSSRDRDILIEELTVYDTHNPDVPSQDPSQPTSSRRTHLQGVIARMCRFNVKKGILEKVNEALKEIVPKFATSATNDLINDNLPRLVTNAVKKERESSQAFVPALISQEFATHAPKIIKELFSIHMQNTVLNVHPTTNTSTAITSDLQQKLYLKMKLDLQSQVDDPELYNAFRKHDHEDHPGDDAPQEGEKYAKSQKTSRISKSVRDEVILEDETPELLNEFQNVNKSVPTIFYHERIGAIIIDILSNQFRDAEKYAYHLEYAKNYM